MSQSEVFIVGGARTPMTEYVGAFKDVSAIELGAVAARAALQKSGVQPEWIEHVVIGNVLQTSADAIYGARHVALKAGLPIEVPALTVNRLCGSGIQAAVSGAQLIQLDEADVVLAGGIENMSQAPHVIRGLRSGLRLGQGELEDSLMGRADRLVLRLLDGADRGELRRQVRHHPRRSGRLRAAQPAAGRPRVDRGPLRRRSRAGRSRDPEGHASWSAATITCARTPRSKGWPSCRRSSRRTAP